MDYSKFKWLLDYKRLFMPAAKVLGEPLEGTEPEGNEIWWKEQIRQAKTDKQKEIIRANQQKLSAFAKEFGEHYYVSCWHMNENENNGMWKKYTKSPESIAIQTTYKDLRSLLSDYIEIGVVRYIDYDNESLPSLNMFEYITHKHIEFCYEREVRAVASPPALKELGGEHFDANLFESEENSSFRVFAPEIDIIHLINKIVTHPISSLSFRNRVDEICNDCLLPRPISSLFEANC